MCFYGPYYVWLNVGNAWLSHPVDGTRLAALPECFACPTHAAREWGEGTFAYRVMRGGRKDYDVVALPEEGDIHLAVWRATRTGPKVCSRFLNFTLSSPLQCMMLVLSVRPPSPSVYMPMEARLARQLLSTQ